MNGPDDTIPDPPPMRPPPVAIEGGPGESALRAAAVAADILKSAVENDHTRAMIVLALDGLARSVVRLEAVAVKCLDALDAGKGKP